MKKYSNKLFRDLKDKYGISIIEEIDVFIPNEIKDLLNEEIVQTEFGITLNCWESKLTKPVTHENTSIVEDNANHFHVDRGAIPRNEETAFKLGVKTVILLHQKFVNNKLANIQISYSFHTKEMSKQMDKDLNGNIEDEYYYGDRLSFHQIRKGEELKGELEEYKYNAMLILETE